MPVHYAGGVGNLDQVYKFAKSYKLRVIEDAAHAFGTTYKQKRIGGFGDIACFSFDGIKNITSGEGGCIVTEDQSVLEKVADSRLLGVKNDSKARVDRQRSWLFEVEVQGWRYHMSDLMAAIGIVQLDRFDEFTQKRRTLARRYDELLALNPRVTPLQHNYSEVVPHIYVVKIKNLCDREELRKDLLEDGIQTGVHYQPNHLLKLYQYSNNSSLPFPVTEEAFSQILTLPLHPDLQPEDLNLVSSKLLEKLNNH
jgi:dTDP-4-amino-4,6-dideoxygalactose transaminase